MQKFPDFIQLFQQLTALETVSNVTPDKDCSNLTLIELVANWLDDLGFTCQIKQIDHNPKKYNLIASSKKEANAGLLLAAHTDTVPYDLDLWQTNPLQLTELDNRWYGLGTADMKGFLAFIIHIISNLDLKNFSQPIHILASADEETSMIGARDFIKNTQIKPNAAIIGEPTELRPIRAHKGFCGFRLKIIGKSGHSSLPHAGINAISLMHQAISCLQALQTELKTNYVNPLFGVPYPSMNLGVLHAGDAVNRICAEAELQFEIRPTPNISIAQIETLLAEYLQPLKNHLADNLQLTSLYDDEHIPAFECAEDTLLVQTVEQLTNTKSEVVNYATEAPYIQQLCPTLILGPGSIEQAHLPNEFLSCHYYEPTIQLFTKLIHKFCK